MFLTDWPGEAWVVDAVVCRGCMVHLSLWITSEDSSNWPGMWIIAGNRDVIIAYDNMGDLPICGTQNWTRYAMVLDAEGEATFLLFGRSVHRQGSLWVDDYGLSGAAA